MKKLCIFDFDGTLFDTITDVVRHFNTALEQLGYKTLTLEEYKDYIGENADVIIKNLIGENATDEEINKVKTAYEESYIYDTEDTAYVYDGMIELLEELQEKGIKLAVNSNKKPPSLKRYLDKYAPQIEFVDIQGHVPTNPSKPHPYGINTIIEKSNLSKDDAVFIGDSATDLLTAKNAKIDCIMVDWGYADEEVLRDDYILKVVSTPQEILDIVTK